jgi:hypothetical protein
MDDPLADIEKGIKSGLPSYNSLIEFFVWIHNKKKLSLVLFAHLFVKLVMAD